MLHNWWYITHTHSQLASQIYSIKYTLYQNLRLVAKLQPSLSSFAVLQMKKKTNPIIDTLYKVCGRTDNWVIYIDDEWYGVIKEEIIRIAWSFRVRAVSEFY